MSQLTLSRVTNLRIRVWAGHCCEADVVLLDDWRVETVEVHQQHISVVETTLWFQHQSACVCRLPSPWLASLGSMSSCIHIGVVVNVFDVVGGRRSFAVHFVRDNEPPLGECVEQEVFVPLRSTSGQRPWQHIATDIGDLSGERQRVQLGCNAQGVRSIKKSWLQQTEKTDGVTECRSDLLRLKHSTMLLKNMWRQLQAHTARLELSLLNKNVRPTDKSSDTNVQYCTRNSTIQH